MKNNGVMNDKSGDDDTREARWQWKSDNQEETDQDVADEVSEDVDSKGGWCSERND